MDALSTRLPLLTDYRATTAMTNTLYRGTKTLSDASGWLSFFVAGGPRLMGDGQVHVEVYVPRQFGGPSACC